MILRRDLFDNGYDAGGKGWHLRTWKNTKHRKDGPKFGWSVEVTVPYNGGRTLILIEGGPSRSQVVNAARVAMLALGLKELR